MSTESETNEPSPCEAAPSAATQTQNRYAHIKPNLSGQSAQRSGQQQGTGANNHKSNRSAFHLASSTATATSINGTTKTITTPASVAPNSQQQRQHNANYKQYGHSYSFSQVDWREQFEVMRAKLMEKVEEPTSQRRLILVIVCCALLLDNMLYMVIVPIIPDYLRSINAWSTYVQDEHMKPTRANYTMQSNSARHRQRQSFDGPVHWDRVAGTMIYEGEESAIGFLFASKALVQLLVNPFSGALIDRLGYEMPMMFGLTVMFLSTMVFACGQTYGVLFFARSLQGLGSAFADTAGLAMIADRFTEDAERQRALGVALAFISFGSLVAPPFGSILYDAAGKEVPFILLSLVCLLDGALLLLVIPPGTFQSLVPNLWTTLGNNTQGCKRGASDVELAKVSAAAAAAAAEPISEAAAASSATANAKKPTLQKQKSVSRRQSITLALDGKPPEGEPIHRLFRDPCIACCSGALVVANVSLAFLEPTMTIWMRDTMHDLEKWQLGVVWLPAFVPHVFGVWCTIKLGDKYPKLQWLIAACGLILEGLACALLPLCTSFWSLIVPISVICFGLALIDTAILPTLGFLVDTRYVSVYGSIYAIADISYSLSYAVGPIIAGGIVEAIGFTSLNLLIAIVTIGYAPILTMLRSIHDYEPFEKQAQLVHKARHIKGLVGRQPTSESEIDSDDADDFSEPKFADKEQLQRPVVSQPSENTSEATEPKLLRASLRQANSTSSRKQLPVRIASQERTEH